MPAIVHIHGKLLWKWGRTKHGNYVAVCDVIGQTVQATKFSELLATINEALESTFKELVSSGDLERFLRERGWSVEDPMPPRRRNIRFEIPFDLMGVPRRDLKEAIC